MEHPPAGQYFIEIQSSGGIKMDQYNRPFLKFYMIMNDEE
jgi:hypothetical protein